MKAEVKEYLKKEGYVLYFWHKDDIRDKAEEMGIEVTEEQVDDIAEALEETDANFGINWNSIEDEILYQVGE
jgi:uncharacterized protein YpuA (DUF1002 family)